MSDDDDLALVDETLTTIYRARHDQQVKRSKALSRQSLEAAALYQQAEYIPELDHGDREAIEIPPEPSCVRVSRYLFALLLFHSYLRPSAIWVDFTAKGGPKARVHGLNLLEDPKRFDDTDIVVE